MAPHPPENSLPASKPSLPKPKFRLHLDDLRHSGTNSFLSLVPDPLLTLEKALQSIVEYLYTVPSEEEDNNDKLPSTVCPPTISTIPSFIPSIPPTQSVTLILRDFDGLAYTTGNEFDKEIHVALSYVQYCTTSQDPAGELAGVLTHELVHCFQHTSPRQLSPTHNDGAYSHGNGDGNGYDNNVNAPRPPGGLIEGIADFVRLKAGLSPPHWKKPTSSNERPAKWDQGYQHTAYFLAWLEDVRAGAGAIALVNDRLLRVGYHTGESGNNNGDNGSSGVDDNDNNQNSHDDDSNRTAHQDSRESPDYASRRGYLSFSPKEDFWHSMFGVGVLHLWEEYGEYLDRSNGGADNGGNWEIELL